MRHGLIYTFVIIVFSVAFHSCSPLPKCPAYAEIAEIEDLQEGV